jgi:hypothetical protein
MPPLREDEELISPDSGSSQRALPLSTDSPESILEDRYLEDQRSHEPTFFTPN